MFRSAWRPIKSSRYDVRVVAGSVRSFSCCRNHAQATGLFSSSTRGMCSPNADKIFSRFLLSALSDGPSREEKSTKMLPSPIHIPRSNIVEPQSKRDHSATLFLFHGSGGCGEDFKEWLDILNRHVLSFPHIKIVYPTAPIQPYTPNGRLPSNVWFDRRAISIDVPEVKHSIDLICNKAMELIHREVSEGIPINRIVVGGFSMGACLALHLAYRFKRNFAGCVAMSGFLNNESVVYKFLETDRIDNLPELLQFHGNSDTIVPIQWGKKTFDTLKNLGVKGTFVPLNSTDHEIIQGELNYFKEWILQKLPERKPGEGDQ